MSVLDMLTGNLNSLKSEVSKIDLSSVAASMNDSAHRDYIQRDAGIEHYKLIAWIASQFQPHTVMDIGTHYGNSSLAMSLDKNAKIISYDIVEMKRLSVLPENCDYRLGDFREDPNTMNAPFIFIDVDPHDGIQEKEFHEFFISKGYRGITLWDDIYCNQAMKDWWNSISPTHEKYKKVDLTSVGHWSGTGMIVYE